MSSPKQRDWFGYCIVALCIAFLAAIPSAADSRPGGDDTPASPAADSPAGPVADTPDDTPQIPVDEPPQPKKRAFPDLVKALRGIDGVVKAEYARMDTGKNCVFAWFEGKDAAMRWYYSDVHQAMLDAFYPDRLEREPLFKVPDDVGPMMGLGCTTISKETGVIEQIAIEVYKPLHGGFSGGGRFGPDEWKDIFEHYDQYEDAEEGEEAEGSEAEEGGEPESTDSEEPSQDSEQR